MVVTLIWGNRCATSWCELIVSSVIIETYFCFHRDIWIVETDFYMYFYHMVLSPCIVTVQLINLKAS